MSGEKRIDVRVDTSVYLLVYCGVCGDPLKITKIGSGEDLIEIELEPCENCENKSYKEGYKDGLKENEK